MQAVITQANFNQWTSPESAIQLSTEKTERLLAQAKLGSKSDPNLQTLVAIYYWKLGNQNQAIDLWEKRAATDPLAILLLNLTNATPLPKESQLAAYRHHPAYPILLALVRQDPSSVERPPIHNRLLKLLSPLPRNYNRFSITPLPLRT